MRINFQENVYRNYLLCQDQIVSSIVLTFFAFVKCCSSYFICFYCFYSHYYSRPSIPFKRYKQSSSSSSFRHGFFRLSRHPSLSFITLDESNRRHPLSAQSCWMKIFAGWPTLAGPCVGVQRRPFILTSPAVSNMFCLPFLVGSRDGWQVAVQLLFCRLLLPEFVQNRRQHPWVVAINFFLLAFRKSPWGATIQ